jgi:hypothetical protein
VIQEAARTQPRIDPRVQVTRETSPATYARAMGEALAHRYGAGNTLSEMARPFVNERFPAIVRRWAELASLSTTGLSEATIGDGKAQSYLRRHRRPSNYRHAVHAHDGSDMHVHARKKTATEGLRDREHTEFFGQVWMDI